MITWFDYLLSVVIAGMLVFIIGNTRLRSQNASIESAQFYTAKTSMRGLADLIDQDMPNIGAGMLDPNLVDPANPGANAAVLSYSIDPNGDSWFRFLGFPGPLANPEPHEIEYRWRKTGTKVTLSDDLTDVDVFEVERRVKPPGGAFQVTGGNIVGNVTDFQIVLFDNDLNPIASVAAGDATVRYVDVSFSMISPFGVDDLVEQTRWHKRYRPINMADQSRIVIRGLFPVP